MNTLLLTDYYKTEHHRMLPKGTTMIYSNFTPRKSRIKGIDKIVFFGLQHFIKEYLIEHFNKNFFILDICDVANEYTRHISIDTKHIEDLHKLGYLPIEIKAVEEGLNYALQCDYNFSKDLKKNLVITCLDQYEIDINKLLNGIETTFDKVFISKGDSLKDISLYK